MSINKEKIYTELLDTVLNAIPEIIILLDEEGNYVNILTSDSEDLIDSKENLIGENVKEILPTNVADKYLEYCKMVHKNDKIKSFDYYLIINGEKKYFDVNFSPICPDNGRDKLIVATINNITKLKISEEKLREQKAYFEQLFNNSTEAIVLLDNKHHVIKVNKKFENLFEYEQSEMINENLDDFILPENFANTGRKYTEKVKQGEKISTETVRRTKNGKKINVFIQGFPIDLANGQLGIYALYHDITERKKKEKKIRFLSFHDEMTGLYNRRYFENELKRLEFSRKYPITIIVGDLDGLKIVNDNYGHKKGDEYLISAADILKSTARNEDIIARIGGDEFGIILPSTDWKEAKKFCSRIQNNIKEINKNNEPVKPLSISLGFAVMEDNDKNLDKVFNEADQKMYINKGRN